MRSPFLYTLGTLLLLALACNQDQAKTNALALQFKSKVDSMAAQQKAFTSKLTAAESEMKNGLNEIRQNSPGLDVAQFQFDSSAIYFWFERQNALNSDLQSNLTGYQKLSEAVLSGKAPADTLVMFLKGLQEHQQLMDRVHRMNQEEEKTFRTNYEKLRDYIKN